MPNLEQRQPDGARAVDRRSFLGGSLLIVGGAALGRIGVAEAAPRGNIEGFLELSRVATGMDKLPRTLASKYLLALDAAPQLKLKPSEFLRRAGYANGTGPKDLRALEHSAAFRAEAGRECVRAVAAAWWSGVVPARRGDEVITFSDTLVWRVVHEPTTCQGATGSWSKPGRAVE